jgi:putative transcriptional regulator
LHRGGAFLLAGEAGFPIPLAQPNGTLVASHKSTRNKEIDVMRHLRTLHFVAALVLAALSALAAPAAQAQSADAVLLVAKPQLQDAMFSATVLLVVPLDSGGHAGFILNKPTPMSLGEAFPDDEPSQKVHEPVYLGGPVSPNIIFALVRRTDSPGEGAVRFTPELYLAMASDTVDRIIQTEADHARFFAGAMLWRPGELRRQVDDGAWYVRDADADVALSKNIDRLWENLVADSERHVRTF